MKDNMKATLFGSALPISLCFAIAFIATLNQWLNINVFEWYLSTSAICSGLWGFAVFYAIRDQHDPISKRYARWLGGSFIITNILVASIVAILTNGTELLGARIAVSSIITFLCFSMGAGISDMVRVIRKRYGAQK